MSRLRQLIAAQLALVVVVLTLGLVRVNWTGRPTAAAGAADRGNPVALSAGDRPARERS